MTDTDTGRNLGLALGVAQSRATETAAAAQDAVRGLVRAAAFADIATQAAFAAGDCGEDVTGVARAEAYADAATAMLAHVELEVHNAGLRTQRDEPFTDAAQVEPVARSERTE